MRIQRKIFAVGDIHGCLQKLTTLLGRLPMDAKNDFLIFLGDYINRGPDSRQVIQFLIQLKQQFRNVIFLVGNHEYELMEYARTGDPERLQTLRPLGVEPTLTSYGNCPMRSLLDLSFMPDDHREFFMSLRPFYRMDGYLFVHAGVIPGEDVSNSSPGSFSAALPP